MICELCFNRPVIYKRRKKKEKKKQKKEKDPLPSAYLNSGSF